MRSYKRFVVTLILSAITSIYLSYVVKPGDTIGIDFYSTNPTPESHPIQITSNVDMDGYASLPYVGRKKVSGLTLEEIQKIIEDHSKPYLSSIVSVYLVKTKPQYVFFQGAVSGTVNIAQMSKEERRLVYLAGLTTAGRSLVQILRYSDKVRIIRNGEVIHVDLKKFYETGDNKYNPILQENDVVYFPLAKSVAVFGNVPRPGVYQINYGDTLLQILSRAGAPIDNKIIKSIRVYRKERQIDIKLPDEKEKLMSQAEDQDIIEVIPYSEINVYLMGEISRKLILSERDKPTLRKIISNAEISFIKDVKRKIVLIRNGSEESYIISDPLQLPDKPLQNNDIIGIYITNPVSVYVASNLPYLKTGVISFENTETPSIKNLLFKLGIGEKNLGIFITKNGSTSYLISSNILNRNEDLLLSNYDYVYISDKPFGEVYLIGFKKGITGLLHKKETLFEVLQRVSISVPTTDVDEIEIMKKDGILSIKMNELYTKGKEIYLENGDTVSIKTKTEKYVYVTGDISKTIVFSKNETISKEKVIAKLGVDYDSIESIDGDFKSGGMITIKLKKPIKVFIGGNAVNNRLVILDVNEPHDVRSALSKAGGVKFGTDITNNYEVRVQIKRNNSIIFDKTVPVDKVFTLDEKIDDGDVIVFNINSIKVNVFGGNRQGIFTLPGGSGLKDLLLKIGGINVKNEKLILIRDGKQKTVYINYNNIPDVQLHDNDILIFTEGDENFVYVLGDVDTPGPVYTGGFEINILKALSLTGGLRDWESKEKVYIIRNSGKEEVYNLSYEDLSKVKVKSGDVIYVKPRTFNKIYVLGAVNRPSLVYIDTNTSLLDAVMKAGGFRKGADLSKVYVFRGGIKGTIEIYDMNWVTSGKFGKNPKINPGDIVYVPDSPYMTITEIMSFVQTTITFINNSINFYRNVDSLIQGK